MRIIRNIVIQGILNIMNMTFSLSGNKSVIESQYFPPLSLNGDYECGLLYFSACNSIPNINDKNNLFVYGEDSKHSIVIPTGTYDLNDISTYLQENANNCEITLKPNNNTLKCSLFCSDEIHFEHNNTIGELLGFPKVKLEAYKWYDSVYPITILPTSVIRIDCDLIKGSYTNGLESHTIYEFVPNIPPGYQFIEVPKNVIYFPLSKEHISYITIQILDAQGRVIDFRGETIQLCLHIRKSQ